MTATTASCSSAVNTIDNAKIRKQHQSLPQCHPRGLQPQSPLPPRYPYTQPQRSQAYQSINTHSHNNATATTSSSSGSSSGTSTKVKPYRFRDEPQKKIIVKTELCRAILEGKPCRFGSKCNFAHHENELKYKTLVERHDAGLIDKETYRTRPCLDHIMVGDCPMSVRCTCLHDPRISAKSEKHKWWLPHCALQSTHLDVDVHVDWYGKYNFSLSHYGHPFGKSMNGSMSMNPTSIREDGKSDNSFPLGVGDWDDFYHAVINADGDVDSNKENIVTSTNYANKLNYVPSVTAAAVPSSLWSMPMNGVPQSTPIMTGAMMNPMNDCSYQLTESQKLQITLAMRHEFKDMGNIYKYQPTHKILNEICMLIQTKAFNVSHDTSPFNSHYDANTHTDSVQIIPVQQFDPLNPNHVIVREIAFGPLCSPNDRPLALWFNILDRDVQVCTVKERLRPKRTERKLLDKKNLASLQCKVTTTPLATKSTSTSSMGHHGITGNGSISNFVSNGSSSGSGSSGKITYAQVIGNQNNNLDNQCHYNNPTMRMRRYIPVSFDDDNHHLEKPFHIFCPKDEAAFKLVSDTLLYHLKVLVWKNNTAYTTHRARSNLPELKQRLEHTFSSLQAHFSNSYWPISKGRENVDEHMLIPNVDTKYVVPESASIYQRGIWESFVKTASEGFEQFHDIGGKTTAVTRKGRGESRIIRRGAAEEKEERSPRQIQIFKKLSEGKSPCDESTRTIPYINRRSAPPGFSDNMGIFSDGEEKDWGTVRAHYLSKKTQQQHGKQLLTSSVQDIVGRKNMCKRI